MAEIYPIQRCRLFYRHALHKSLNKLHISHINACQAAIPAPYSYCLLVVFVPVFDRRQAGDLFENFAKGFGIGNDAAVHQFHIGEHGAEFIGIEPEGRALPALKQAGGGQQKSAQAARSDYGSGFW